MPVFAVAVKEPEKLTPVLQEIYPNAFIEVWPGLYFVADEATSKQVSEKLGVINGGRGSVFVSLISGYYGFGPKEAWEWLAVKTTPS